MTITIDLDEEQMRRLVERARQMGITPEALAKLALDQYLARPAPDVATATAYVLEKNRELLRRLAEHD